MWFVYFIIAVIAVCIILVHVTIEVNNSVKASESLKTNMKKHYDIE